jgi:hypothetical protein
MKPRVINPRNGAPPVFCTSHNLKVYIDMYNMNNNQPDLRNLAQLRERKFLLEELLENEGDERYADKLLTELRYIDELYSYKLRKGYTI